MTSDWVDFLVQNHDVFGITIENWMIIAVIMILVALIGPLSNNLSR